MENNNFLEMKDEQRLVEKNKHQKTDN